MAELNLAVKHGQTAEAARANFAKVIKEAYPDPTAPEEDWSVIDVAPLKPLKTPVPLDVIKSDPALTEMALLKRSRLSVVPVTKVLFDHILKLARTKV